MENLSNLTAFQGASLLTLVELVGDAGAKIDNPVMTYGGYNALAFILTKLLKGNGLIVTNSLWDGMSNIMTTLLGLLYGEKPSATDWLAIAMISGGIFLLKKNGVDTTGLT